MVCFVAMLALTDKAAGVDVAAAELTGVGAGRGDELEDKEAG